MIIAVEKSGNMKVGKYKAAATYAPMSTCSDSCPFKNNGCYAQQGKCRIQVSRIERENEKYQFSPLILACIEAGKIRKMSGRRPLRMHVSGDFHDSLSAEILDNAAAEYTEKHGQPVWAYTHNWQSIPRDIFKNISILASCENEIDRLRAHAAGYRAALVAPEHSKPSGATVCPAITRGKTCVECRLCMKADKIKKDIVFYPHGPGAKKINEVIR